MFMSHNLTFVVKWLYIRLTGHTVHVNLAQYTYYNLDRCTNLQRSHSTHHFVSVYAVSLYKLPLSAHRTFDLTIQYLHRKVYCAGSARFPEPDNPEGMFA